MYPLPPHTIHPPHQILQMLEESVIVRDLFACIIIAIHSCMWGLRMASMKEMCPVFTAFDRLNYMKNLPQHFGEVSSLPDVVKDCFSKEVCVLY